ncbi:hypothetical protein B0H16DRAFT_1527478 [Mycena metata]|uniref:Uncharacterized protein n=1 Tax=Mycena metata TaxID=1033252 RepID=A0AAD7JGH8_9AGAR|nr:hypothetical protein B0H16DRAFT_1527478 [Mycena metata]
MSPPNLSETIDEERTIKRSYGFYAEEFESLAELSDATTEMMPRTQIKLIDVYAIFLAELDTLRGKIVERDERIALLRKLRGEYLEEVETHKRTVKKYEEQIAKQAEENGTLDQAALDMLRASLQKQIGVLTEERDRQSARLKELSAALAKEQADLRDLVDELAKKEQTISGLREQADETARLTAAAEGILRSEIQALKETVVQQTTQITSLERDMELERDRRREAEEDFATRRRTLETELEQKRTAYADVQRQAAEAESRHRAELEALRAQISDADAKLSKIQEDLRREQEANAGLQSQSSESREAVAKYEEERRRREDAESAHEASRAENEKLQSQVSSSLTKVEELQTRLHTVQLDAEQNEKEASKRIHALEGDLTSAHDELKSAQDAMDKMQTTTQALEKKLTSSEKEIEELRQALQATQPEAAHVHEVYRKEVEILHIQISTLEQELKNVRSEKDKVVESMRADAERSQKASAKESQDLRETIKALEQRLAELQEQLKTAESESVRIQEASRKLQTELDAKMQQLQDEANQTVTDVEIKFQEKLKNSRTEFSQLVQIIVERDKLIVRMREEITRMTTDTKAQILRIERRHREEEQTFYRRLEEKDETIAALERENLKDRGDRSMAFTRAAAKIEDELHYLHEYQATYSKTDVEMEHSESENASYRSEVDKMQAQYGQSMQNLRTAMSGKDFMNGAFSSSSSAVTAEVTLRPRPAGKGFEPEAMSVDSEEKTQSQSSHVIPGPNGKPMTVRTEEEKTMTRRVKATAGGKLSQTFKFSESTDVKSAVLPALQG